MRGGAKIKLHREYVVNLVRKFILIENVKLLRFYLTYILSICMIINLSLVACHNPVVLGNSVLITGHKTIRVVFQSIIMYLAKCRVCMFY